MDEEAIKEALPSLKYARAIIRQDFFNIKVPKETRLSKCSTCVKLRMEIFQRFKDQEETDSFKRDLDEHLVFQAREREAHKLRIEFAENKTQKVLMITSDSPSAIILPNFCLANKVKEVSAKGMSFRWTGN